MSTLVYKYGARPPLWDGKIREQMKLAREYYNQLIEAENMRRQAVKWGSGTSPLPPHDHTDDKNHKCSECRDHWELWRGRYYSMPPLDLKPLRARAIAAGLYRDNYMIAEEAFAPAWQKTDVFSEVRYKSWKEGGVMGVNIQQGQQPDAKVKIEKAPDHRIGCSAGQRHIIKLRVASDEHRKPIWSEPVKIEMHRPMQGRPVAVEICQSYMGLKEIWSVNITCTDILPRLDSSPRGVVAIDVGWRTMDGGIRIAYATGDDGMEREFMMSHRWKELTDRADRIRGNRDTMLNTIKLRYPVLARHNKPRAAREHAMRTLATDIELVGWARWDEHMEKYELGCRRRSENARRDAMRKWLRDLRRQYGIAIIKNSVHKEMKDHKRAVADGMPTQARRNAQHAAPGEVIEEVCKVFDRKTGVAIVDAAGTTATCVACGPTMPGQRLMSCHQMDVGPGLMVVCERCGESLDRDIVSTRNLLYLYSIGETKKPTARKTTARFAKLHKKNKEVQQCQDNGL